MRHMLTGTIVPSRCCKTETCRFLAEVLYVFGDAHRQAWVENRWLYNKEEVQDIVPKNRCETKNSDRNKNKEIGHEGSDWPCGTSGSRMRIS